METIKIMVSKVQVGDTIRKSAKGAFYTVDRIETEGRCYWLYDATSADYRHYGCGTGKVEKLV